MFYHASDAKNIKVLEPRGEDGLVYFSTKRENVLVYLVNAVKKFCNDNGIRFEGAHWGPYGFTKEGLLQIEEYYEGALEKTYKGMSAYIYSVNNVEDSGDCKYIKNVAVFFCMNKSAIISDIFDCAVFGFYAVFSIIQIVFRRNLAFNALLNSFKVFFKNNALKRIACIFTELFGGFTVIQIHKLMVKRNNFKVAVSMIREEAARNSLCYFVCRHKHVVA